jgi:pimeloyl-ACP methyl ester carboxylesterase
MTWLRTLWQTGADTGLGAWWGVRYSLRPGEPGSLATGAGSPVLIIPGVYETWQFLLPIARRLHAEGHPVHALPALGRNIDRIPDAAALAQRYLDEHDLRSVTIVAHSKGGLIGKHMMASDDVTGRIDRMIAIATPFSGSTLAKYAPVRTLRVFRPTGSTLTGLAENLQINSRITSIFGEFDPMIPARSRLEGATNLEFPVVGHFRILTDRRVLDAVSRAVDAR